MKKPDLSFNHYFPFYTRKITGVKKYYYCVETVMHISAEFGILISIGYKQKNMDSICIMRITDRTNLFDIAINAIHISYTDFAEDVKTAYRYISAALRTLSPEPAYRETLMLSTYFKFNPVLKLEVNHWHGEIKLSYGSFEYKIMDGKKVENNEPVDDGSEEYTLLKRVSAAVRVIESHRTYQEIASDYFEKQLDDEWDCYAGYFAAPKCIRKNEYRV
ncbi:hypothetical protein [Dysgonomonas gadei]|uniref:Uncharacterized protein n=1 Tax=Dysgonomonas gadei ATCC BAA-286 TaxID=742766 RepID=F5J1B1_9BACT|nr:hypothetical protein [Dysgonomonas gadei]EGK00485.1 hypothetical protein HMPREF9455_03128 [Dysgonomonas gadei ATCC BAA-286]